MVKLPGEYPYMERVHIPPGEKEGYWLKGADWKEILASSQKGNGTLKNGNTKEVCKKEMKKSLEDIF